ncbi:MAG: ATP-dependent Clp protease proteolytic subunit [Planctomycetota bacterium]
MSLRWLLPTAAVVFALAGVFGLTSVGVLAVRLIQEVDAVGGAAFLAEPAVDLAMDRLNESGFAEPPLDPEDPLLRSRIIVVTEGMNERVARRVIRQLLYLDMANSEVPITMHLSTPGGWLDAAFAIVDTMRSIRPPVTVIATGGCYSAGTVVLAGATGERLAAPQALLSIHVNDYLDDGPLGPDTQELARFRRIYADGTRVPQAWFDEPGDNHFYLNVDQALEYGLIERVVGEPPADAGEARTQRRPAA